MADLSGQSNLLGSFDGYSGKLELYSDRVVIFREAGMNKMYGHKEGKLEIMLSDIRDVQFKKGKAFADGYILFTLKSDTGKVMNPYHDIYSVVFPKSKNVSAEDICNKTRALIR